MSTFAEWIKSKYIEPKMLPQHVQALKNQGKRIVTLNGSFDLLHAGHLEIIYQAKQQGDVLIVALNTDESIQTYKNPSRPIIPLNYRLQMMASLSMVDYVTWSAETNPIALLRQIQPDVHVNGAEYGTNCIEADVVKAGGGALHVVELVPSLSTSAIIKKITTLCD